MTSTSNTAGSLPNEKKVVLEDLLNEIEAMKLEHEWMSGKLSEQENFIKNLTEKNEKKDDIIQVLEQEIERLSSANKAEIELVKEEASTKNMEKEHTINILQIEISRLRDEGKIIKQLEAENMKLRESLADLANIKEKVRKIERPLYEPSNSNSNGNGGTTTQQNQNPNDIISEYDDYKTKMDVLFKYEIQQNRDKLKLELDTQSREAVEENERMKKMINSDNKSLKVMLDRFKTINNETDHQTTTTNATTNNNSSNVGVRVTFNDTKDTNNNNNSNANPPVSNDANNKEIEALKNKILGQREQLHLIQTELYNVKLDRANYELLYTELEQQHSDLKRLHEKYIRKKTELEIWRGRAMKFGGKIAEMGSTNPMISPDLIKEKEKMEKELLKQQKKKDLFEGGKEGHHHLRETQQQHAERRRMELQAKLQAKQQRDMEMLSIWNSNYDFKERNNNNKKEEEESDDTDQNNKPSGGSLGDDLNSFIVAKNNPNNDTQLDNSNYVEEVVGDILNQPITQSLLQQPQPQPQPQPIGKRFGGGERVSREGMRKDMQISVLARGNNKRMRPLWQPILKPTSPHRMLPTDMDIYSNNNNNNNDNNIENEVSSNASSATSSLQFVLPKKKKKNFVAAKKGNRFITP